AAHDQHLVEAGVVAPALVAQDLGPELRDVLGHVVSRRDAICEVGTALVGAVQGDEPAHRRQGRRSLERRGTGARSRAAVAPAADCSARAISGSAALAATSSTVRSFEPSTATSSATVIGTRLGPELIPWWRPSLMPKPE